jgi:luciferase family oxidoreductase group 1
MRYDGAMTYLSILDQSPIRSGATPADAVDETLRLAEFVDRLGYCRYWLAEHHSSNGLAGSSPEILIPLVASRTERIRVGSGGVMLSHYSPLKVAENFRMLETLFPGRIDLGIGRAPGSDQLTDQALTAGPGALGPEHYPAQVRDLIGYLEGRLPDDHPFARISVMPAGPGAPDVWMLGSSNQSAMLAAYFGRPYSFAHFITAEGGPEAMEYYRRNYSPSERAPEPRGSIGVFVLCADSDEAAERLMRSRDLWTLRQRRGITAPVPTFEEADAYDYEPRDLAMIAYNRERCVWGTPDKVKAALLELGQRYGVDEFVLLTICARFEDRLRSYELLAEAFDLAPARDAAEETAPA